MLNKKIIIYILLFFILFSTFGSNSNLEIINQLEKKYEEKISDMIKMVYPEKYFLVKVIINPLIKSYSINNRNSYNIKVSIFIDGSWKIVYGEKNKPVVNKDGSRLRKFIYRDDGELKKIKQFIITLIEYKEERGDNVSVQCIQYDRTKEFYDEDLKWIRRQRTTFALFAGLIALLLLFIATIVYRLIVIEIERRVKLKTDELKVKNKVNK